MSELGAVIRSMIAQEGPISLERYMGLALGHPRHGYYMTRDPFGAGGDFITSPEISQMFGEIIGVWCADYWARMGAPGRINLVELGPGRGTLMRDVLRAARVMPGFAEAIDVQLVEMSPVLRAAQKETLRNAAARVEWFQHFAELPAGPAIILANEFFDALPVRHFVRTRDGWRERVVGLGADEGLSFGLDPNDIPSLRVVAPEGSIIETGVIGQRLMADIATRLTTEGGVALAIDYGYTRSVPGETLQAMRAHAYVHPLRDPGEADLTTHVDFAALARAARSTGALVHGPVTQADFLLDLGIAARADALKRAASPARGPVIESELRRLTAHAHEEAVDASRASGMGVLFKVIAITGDNGVAPAGFEKASTP
jgi:SAM-dependent MidA family methyltransferase